MSQGDDVDYTKLQLADQGFVVLSTTENANYDTDFLAVAHDLGYTPIALAYYLEDPGFGGITPNNFNGVQMPNISVGVSGVPGSLWAHYQFNIDKQNITFFRESLHLNTSGNYDVYIKYFLFKQPAQA